MMTLCYVKLFLASRIDNNCTRVFFSVLALKKQNSMESYNCKHMTSANKLSVKVDPFPPKLPDENPAYDHSLFGGLAKLCLDS